MYKLDAHITKAIDRHRKHHPRVTVNNILKAFDRISKKLLKGTDTVIQKRMRRP